jgi:hypothetical protein
MGKTDKKTILKAVYDDFDFAASKITFATYGNTSRLCAQQKVLR